MKKHSFGVMLFLVGSIGYLVLSIYLSMHPCNYNGLTGLYASLLGNDLLVPYIFFCAFGIIGLVICVFETFFRQKWDARRKQEHTGQLRDLSKKIL